MTPGTSLTCSAVLRSCYLAACLLTLSFAQPMGAGKVEWTPGLDAAFEKAATEKRVVLLALGEVGESRSDQHLKDLYRSKLAAPFLESSVNVAAWSFAPEERDDLPEFDGMTLKQHLDNHEAIVARWVTPNESGVIALPQHVWVSAEGETLLSCPWEIEPEEFAWCAAEAMRRAKVDGAPDQGKDARPPRRLLLGQTARVLDSDELGRGLEPTEIEAIVKSLKKRFITMGDRAQVTQLLFTDDDDAVDFMEKQLGLWDMGGAGTAGILDFVVALIGTISPARYLPVLEDQAGDNRESRRRQVAIAYENLGTPEGLSVVKKAWKKEKDEETRADWARAMGASGRGSKAVAKVLIRAAQKEKSERVRRGAILGLGHVAPEPSALEFLVETARDGAGLEREAAILALGMARAIDARALIEKVQGQDVEETTKAAAAAAISVLDGGNLNLLEKEVQRVSESDSPRARLFFRAVPQMPALGGGGARGR